MYEISLRSGIDAKTLQALDRGERPNPGFVHLARLDAMGIPIMSWAGVPAIRSAILDRPTRKEQLKQRSINVGKYLKAHPNKRWYKTHPKEYAALQKQCAARRKARNAMRGVG